MTSLTLLHPLPCPLPPTLGHQASHLLVHLLQRWVRPSHMSSTTVPWPSAAQHRLRDLVGVASVASTAFQMFTLCPTFKGQQGSIQQDDDLSRHLYNYLIFFEHKLNHNMLM